MKNITLKVTFTLADDIPSECSVTEKDFCKSIVDTLKEEINTREVKGITASLLSSEGVEFLKVKEE